MSGNRRPFGFLDGTVDGTFLAPVRVAVGGMMFFHGMVAARELRLVGYSGEAFHMSLLPDRLIFPEKVYLSLVALRCVLAAMVVLGIRPRPALFFGGLLALYSIAVDTVGFHHNRYSLACYAILLSFTPCDKAWLLGGDERGEAVKIGPSWALLLCQLQVALVYLASGGSKLLDPDWRAGTVLYERFVTYGAVAEAQGVPHGVLALLGTPLASSILAKLAIFTELTLPLLLFGRRTRPVAIAWGIVFHVVIQLTSAVEIFSVLTLTMYGTFVTGDVRARRLRYDPESALARSVAALVKATDWFARFEVKPWEPDGLVEGHRIVVFRRDGSRATGLSAVAMLARGIPLFFLGWGPLALAASFGKNGDVGNDL
jgi:hypothetical protein